MKNLVPTAALLALTGTAAAQTPAPRDKPVAANSEAALDRRIAPAVAKAKAGLPAVKKRFLAGLPKGDVLYLTTRLSDPGGSPTEQVFVRVVSWQNGRVDGDIDNDLQALKTFKRGQGINFPESRILDYTINHAGGTQEGNFVGRALAGGK